MESKRNTTVRIVPVALLHVFHLPSPQYGLPGSFTTHPSLSVSFFGSFLLFYHMYFTYHPPSMGSPGLLPPTPPYLCHSSDRSCCSTTCISLTIPPVWAPRVFYHPPLLICVILRIVPVVLPHVFHLPSPQCGLPGSFATHPSLSVSLFGSFLLFYYMYFTYHLPSMGSPGLLPPTPPFLCQLHWKEMMKEKADLYLLPPVSLG